MKLELILNKGIPEEFIFDLGRLQERINIYTLNSQEVHDLKHEIMNKYNICKKQIKANYFLYQSYIHLKETN